ncbi:MAG: hypothetical protein C3F15_01965 [Holophagae bacterium]|nr:MAG: hypothetical protein C3F15_01965 [Holophagae bacterium]
MEVEVGLVPAAVEGGGGSDGWGARDFVVVREHLVNLLIAVGDQLVTVVEQLDRLAQCKQVLVPPVSVESLGERRRIVLAPAISVGCELCGVAFAVEDRPHNPHTSHAGDLADHLPELDVHLGEGFLDLLNVQR